MSYASDSVTVFNVADGKDQFSVVLSNESHVFTGGKTSVKDTQKTTCKVTAFVGSEQKDVQVLEIDSKAVSTSYQDTLTTGLQSKVNTTAKASEVTISFKALDTMQTGSGLVSIKCKIPDANNTIIVKQFSFAIAFQGSDGHSPTITAETSAGVTTIKIDGKESATIKDGQNGSSLVNKGNWTTNTAYDVNNYVYYATNKTSYVCKEKHTSGTTFDTSKWTILSAQGQQGESATQYYIHYVYADDTTGKNYSTNQTRKYIGTYTDTIKADASSFADLPEGVVWSQITGTTGATGAIGATGGKGATGVNTTDVILSSNIINITSKIDGNTDKEQRFTITFGGRIGGNKAAVTLTNPTLPTNMTQVSNTAGTTSKDGSLVLRVANGVIVTNDSTQSGEITLTFKCNSQTITKKLTWCKAISRLVVDELLVNKLGSTDYDGTAGSEKGFFFNGTNTNITLPNGSVVPAQTEIHYGNAIYNSDYIKNSDTNLCVALGYKAGYATPVKGTWNADTVYNIRDIVIYDSEYWISTRPSNQGESPNSSESWKKLEIIDSNSIAIGVYSLSKNITGDYNIAVGNYSLRDNFFGSYNTAVGNYSLSSNTAGYNNTAIGNYSLRENVSGFNNTAVGNYSLSGNIGGRNNTAVGDQSLTDNFNGSYNTAVGNYSLSSNKIGYDNTAIGYYSLRENVNGDYNIAVGNYSLSSNTTGYKNTAIGYYSLSSNETGYNNTAIGTYAGKNIQTGNNNICIGYDTRVSSESASNEINIGNRIFVNSSGLFFGTSWTDKEGITPNTYSTNEKVIGTWINGKPIYRRVFTGLNFGNIVNAYDTVGVTASNIEELISGKAIRSLPHEKTVVNEMSFDIRQNTIYYWLNERFSECNIFIAEYTKTTD